MRSYYASLVSFIRINYFRLLGAKIGKSASLSNIYYTWPHQIQIGSQCNVEQNVFFKFDGIWQPGPSIILGDRVFIGSNCEFNIRKRILIGDDCLVASGCRFIDHDHGHMNLEVPMSSQVGVEKDIIIGNDVWLGVNVIVLKGVTIGKSSIVAAGSVVTKSILPFEIWAGVPAKRVRCRQGSLDIV